MNKELKFCEPFLIATHDGVFHPDEVLAVAVINVARMAQGHKRARVVRTRDNNAIASADAAIDVGGVYNPEWGRYDHHQDASLPASCNLVLDDWSDDLVKTMQYWPGDYLKEVLFNDISAMDCNATLAVAEKPLDGRMNFGQIIKDFNPAWEGATPQDFDSAFGDAVRFAEQVIINLVAKCQVVKRQESAILFGMNRQVIGLCDVPIPIPVNEWRTLFGGDGIKLVTYPDVNGLQWNLFSLYTNDINLTEWCGVDRNGGSIFDTPGCVFVHKAGFFAAFKDKESAIGSAKRILKRINK